MNLIPLAPNARTHERKRLARQKERQRLIDRIGIRLEDAPLYNEELRFMAYQESLGK
jgi:hypothetical protein